MKKMLSLLVVSVFVAVAAVSAQAVELNSGASSATFTASVSFLPSGPSTFGVTLRKMAAGENVKPDLTNDTAEVTQIDWFETGTTDFLAGVVAGQPATDWVNSKVYAVITNTLTVPTAKVLVYTDNAHSTGDFKSTIDPNATGVTGDGAIRQQVGALTEANGKTSIPLSYRVLEAAVIASSAAYTEVDLNPDEFGTFVVQDKMKRPYTNLDTGTMISPAYNEDLATIAKGPGNGEQSGNRLGFREDAVPGQFGPTNFWWNNTGDYYMFFGSLFNNTQAKKYGTDTLTFELVGAE